MNWESADVLCDMGSFFHVHVYIIQMHWQNVVEIIAAMEKVGKDANKIYDQVVSSSDDRHGPSPTKIRLLAELDELHNTNKKKMCLSTASAIVVCVCVCA